MQVENTGLALLFRGFVTLAGRNVCRVVPILNWLVN